LEQTQEPEIARLSCRAPPPELEEANLQVIQRVDVGVAEAYRFSEYRLTGEQMRCFIDLQDRPPAAMIFLLDTPEDGFAGRRRTHERSISAGNIEVRLSQGDLRIIDEDGEKRPILIHLVENAQSFGTVIVHEFVDGKTEAVPCGQKVA
jgi:hypothetical protein